MPVNSSGTSLGSNRLLAKLPEAELRRIAPLLKPVPLPLREVIYRARAPIDWVYFPDRRHRVGNDGHDRW